MRIVECPVCSRRYRFDELKMTQEKVRVKCRKCENLFVISKGMFSPAEGTEAPSSPEPSGASASPPSGSPSPMVLVIEKIPNETARLRIATKLMPLTRERLSVVSGKLSKTPAVFHVELTVREAENLLKAIESTGANAAFSEREPPLRRGKGGPGGTAKPKWKRRLVAALAVLLVAVAGGLTYDGVRQVKKTRVLEQQGIDSVIPNGAFFYVRVLKLESTLQKIEESSIHEGISSLWENLKSTSKVQEILSRSESWEISTGIPFFRLTLMDLIGSDARLALYPGDGPGGPRALLTLKVDLKTKLMEMLGRWLRFLPGGVFHKREGQAEPIFVFHPDGVGREFYYFSQGLIYIVSTSPDLIQASATLASPGARAGDSMASIALLSEKGRRAGVNRIGLFYVGLTHMIRAWLDNRLGPAASSLGESLKAYGDMVGTVSFGKGLVVESTMVLNRDHLGGPLQAFFEQPPALNRTLAYVPKNTVLYASNTGVSPAAYLSWFRKGWVSSPGSTAGLDEVLSQIQRKTGLDLEKEVLPFLGPEFSYVVISPEKESGAPFPSVHLFLEVRDRSKVERAIRKFLRQPVVHSWLEEKGIGVTTIDHKGIPIVSLRYQRTRLKPSPLSALTLCYAFLDDFLVIGIGLRGLEQMVDLSQGQGESLQRDGRFTEVKRLFDERNNGMAYVDLKGVSRLLKGFVTKGPLAGIDLTDSRDPKAQDLQRTLQILETLNYVRTETEFDGDRVRVLAYVGL